MKAFPIGQKVYKWNPDACVITQHTVTMIKLNTEKNIPVYFVDENHTQAYTSVHYEHMDQLVSVEPLDEGSFDKYGMYYLSDADCAIELDLDELAHTKALYESKIAGIQKILDSRGYDDRPLHPPVNDHSIAPPIKWNPDGTLCRHGV